MGAVRGQNRGGTDFVSHREYLMRSGNRPCVAAASRLLYNCIHAGGDCCPQSVVRCWRSVARGWLRVLRQDLLWESRKWEGEAPAEPVPHVASLVAAARQEPRPPMRTPLFRCDAALVLQHILILLPQGYPIGIARGFGRQLLKRNCRSARPSAPARMWPADGPGRSPGSPRRDIVS